jgi:phosphoribosylformylglycinamidine cyclo-ligase
MPASLVYAGRKDLTDSIADVGQDAGKLMLSPTRTYAPVIREVLRQFKEQINGMIHCSGGAQTKVLHFAENVHIIKDKLFPTPPLFQMIQEESGTAWKEMYQVFNMGHRFEIYTDADTAEEIIQLSGKYQIEAKVVGHCESSDHKSLTIKGIHGEFMY